MVMPVKYKGILKIISGIKKVAFFATGPVGS